MWFDLTIVMSAVAGGFVCGRIFSAIGGYARDSAGQSLGTDDEVQAGGPSQQRLAAAAEQLKAQAASMAASVDEHQSRIQAVNHSLAEPDNVSTDRVLEIVHELIDSNRTMQNQLRQARDQIHEQSMELKSAEERACTDALTQIPNRGAFDKFVSRLHARGAYETSTLAMLDVDYFKKFNDRYGHPAGDEVLRVVASLLHSRLQQYGMVARYGGEEFAIVFDGTPAADVERLVEETRLAIRQRETEFENKTLRVTASFGVASLRVDDSIEQWIQRADAALYHSKHAGRNCGHWMEHSQPRKLTALPGPAVESAAAAASNDLKPEIPAAFTVIPNQDHLGATLTQMRQRMHSDVPVYVMAIRHHAGGNEAAMKRLLPAVRATLRSVDRIGYADASTLLICMLSVGESTALERGTQICKSAAAVGLGPERDEDKPITIGISQASADEHFGHTVARAVALAEQATETDEPAVLIESMASASP